jgi:hypothetical protein
MGYLKKAWNAFTTILSSLMYVADVVSDLILAVRYRKQGHKNWGGFTTVFIAIPWTLLAILGAYWACAFSGGANAREYQFVAVMGVFGLLPVGLSILSLKNSFAGSEGDAKESKQEAVAVRIVEVVFEAIPQVGLQMYIAGYTNKIDIVLLVSIVSSLTSATMGLVNGWMGWAELYKNSTRFSATLTREITFSLILYTWTFLQLFTFFTPLALFSSLKGHVSPAHMAIAVYLFFHLIISSLSTFVFPMDSDCSRLCWASTSIIAQVVFVIACNAISAQWFVSIAPFIPNATTSAIPSFVWPDPHPALRNWLIPNITDLSPPNSTLPDFINCTKNESRLSSGISKRKEL